MKRRRKGRTGRIKDRILVMISYITKQMLAKVTDEHIDALVMLVPSIKGEKLLYLSLFGIKDEKERAELIAYCKKRIDASVFLRKRTCQ